jgi:hypothetical protein
VSPTSTPRYTLGLDIGQAHNPTALALLEHPTGRNPTYQLRALHRFPLGTGYPDVVEAVSRRLREPPLRARARIAIDATGVGAPVVDLFKTNVRTSDLYAITITGGTSVGGGNRTPTVPKRDLITTTAVVLQQQRLRIAPSLPDTPTLVDELLSYRVTTSDSGHDRYGPANSDGHDDLLLALSLALWLAETKPFTQASIFIPKGRIPDIDHQLRRDHLFPYR